MALPLSLPVPRPTEGIFEALRDTGDITGRLGAQRAREDNGELRTVGVVKSVLRLASLPRRQRVNLLPMRLDLSSGLGSWPRLRRPRTST